MDGITGIGMGTNIATPKKGRKLWRAITASHHDTSKKKNEQNVHF